MDESAPAVAAPWKLNVGFLAVCYAVGTVLCVGLFVTEAVLFRQEQAEREGGAGGAAAEEKVAMGGGEETETKIETAVDGFWIIFSPFPVCLLWALVSIMRGGQSASGSSGEKESEDDKKNR